MRGMIRGAKRNRIIPEYLPRTNTPSLMLHTAMTPACMKVSSVMEPMLKELLTYIFKDIQKNPYCLLFIHIFSFSWEGLLLIQTTTRGVWSKRSILKNAARSKSTYATGTIPNTQQVEDFFAKMGTAFPGFTMDKLYAPPAEWEKKGNKMHFTYPGNTAVIARNPFCHMAFF